ncbi:MAG: hypothetical protein H6Q88_353, partial [Anaeromyxobacteraceae bacterium]|nr:hypothetical protein [Anaeromyxobacteraceae bacterium]
RKDHLAVVPELRGGSLVSAAA